LSLQLVGRCPGECLPITARPERHVKRR
jgi:hypothetical protein